jgi:hypothetical protein
MSIQQGFWQAIPDVHDGPECQKIPVCPVEYILIPVELTEHFDEKFRAGFSSSRQARYRHCRFKVKTREEVNRG